MRESTQSWREVLLGDEAARLHPPGEARRGRRSDGVLGGAVGSVSDDPNTALLDAQDRQRPELPSEVRPGEGQAGAARDLDGRDEVEGPSAPFDQWLERYDDKYPKATACLARDRDELLAFYDFPRRPTGRTFERPTSSNRPSPRSAIEAREPRAASPDKPCCR